jgi:fructose-bisphosphate aldolase class 1
LIEARVFIEGCVLCPSLVTSGSKSHLKEKVTPFDIASRTYLAISRTIPSAFSGVMVYFYNLISLKLMNPCLCEEDASMSLCEMTKFSSAKKPWVLGYCYSSPYLTLVKVWAGKPDNVKAA